MRYPITLVIFTVLVPVLGLVMLSARKTPLPHFPEESVSHSDILNTVQELDQQFEKKWTKDEIPVSEKASDFEIMRRLSLSLLGTIPSLEEIRIVESDTGDDRLNRWVDKLLQDKRFGDYFAERFSRFIVGTEDGPFLVYRRDRFKSWLANHFQNDRPYNELTKDLISSYGLATTNPGSNFVYATIENDDINESKLSARVVRAFLGQRMDCAQCHDHPFAQWKQSEFEGIAAHFGQLKITPYGLEDWSGKEEQPIEYVIEDPDKKTRVVRPSVPFHPEWIPEEGTRREKLAAWVTHPENSRYERALVNRVWGLMFGKPFYVPVDDIPDPDPDSPDVLDILGKDFREHDYQIHRLIKIIALSKPFQRSSQHQCTNETELTKAEQTLAVFPLTRLRPEQAVGAMLQSSSLKTIDRNSHLLTRFIRFVNETEFVNEYGDLGEDELEKQTVTISQTLLRLNGRFSNELSKSGPFNSAGRIATLSSNNRECVETIFLVCLSRKPTEEEIQYFLPLLRGIEKDERGQVVQDIFWAMFNSPEFSINH